MNTPGTDDLPKKRLDEGTDDALPDPEEFGLDDLLDPGPEESLGLDNELGVDDGAPLFALELPPGEDAAGDVEMDAIPIEGLDSGEEHGWTTDSESASDEPLDPQDLDMEELSPLGIDDGGEEGVDETFELEGELPTLLRDLDEEEGELDADLFPDPIAQALARFAEEGPGLEMLTALPPSACEVLRIEPGCTILCIDSAPPTLAGGAGIYAVSSRLEEVAADGLDRATVTAVVRDGPRVCVGLRPSAARWSSDGGASFSASAGLERADPTDGPLALCREPDSDRLWARTDGGALLRSDDFGRSFAGPLLLQRVVAVAASEDWVYALSVGSDGTSQLARTNDGGQRWAASRGPALQAESEVFLAAAGRLVAVSTKEDPRGPFLSRNGGKDWSRLPGLGRTGPIALIREELGVSLYAAHRLPDEGRAVIARHRPDGGEGLVVLDLPESPADEVHALAVATTDEQTQLAVATEAGLFLVRIELEEVL